MSGLIEYTMKQVFCTQACVAVSPCLVSHRGKLFCRVSTEELISTLNIIMPRKLQLVKMISTSTFTT